MKIITAIGEPSLNNKLREYQEIEIIGKDIQYQEGILEILEERKDIDVVILSNNLPNESNFKIIIDKIKKLKEDLKIIILLKEKNEDLENFLISRKIYKIYYINELNFNNIINHLIAFLTQSNIGLSEEIDDLKNLILNNKHSSQILDNFNISKNTYNEENINLKSNNKGTFLNIEEQYNFYEENKCETIVITGTFGVGKSVFSCLFSKFISDKKYKTLLIDMDIFNKSIGTIFNKEKNNNYIVKINNNLDILVNIEFLIDFQNDLEIYKISELLCSLKREYDLIIIDTSSRTDFKYVKLVLANSEKIIFLVEPNISELKKANNLLEVYIKDFNIDIDKIKIVFNKTNKYQIAKCILEEIFSDFEIIENIEYDEKYNLFINREINNLINKNEFEKIYKKIYDKRERNYIINGFRNK